MRRLSWIIIAISLLVSCQTPIEYIYVDSEPVELPKLSEVISPELQKRISEPLDIVRAPDTVGDLLHNMQEYQRAYIMMMDYSDALEEYIDAIVTIHNGGGIKDGKDVSI